MKKLQKIDYLNILFWLSVVLGLVGGLFYDITYGFVACGIISILIAYVMIDSCIKDTIGVGLVSFLMFNIVYFFILLIVSNTIDAKEKIISEDIYNIRLLENETIVYQSDTLRTNRDVGLYYKCKLENCSSFVEIVYTHVPTNTLWAENIFLASRVKRATK